tara:strand:+ start:94 stop:459 length:366 start_codon:yes stop_codon:yes gene_type:complete
MKWLWEKTSGLVDDWFNLFVIAVVCIGCLIGLYVQGISHSSTIQQIDRQHDIEVDEYKSEVKSLGALSQQLIRLYEKEKTNSVVKDQLIEKQHYLLGELMKKLEQYKRWLELNRIDISRTT